MLLVSNKIKVSHDSLFKTTVSKPDVNRKFLIDNLPSSIQNIVDLYIIKFHKKSFIDQQLKLIICLSIHILVEHQSRLDEVMSFRIQLYMLKIMDIM